MRVIIMEQNEVFNNGMIIVGLATIYLIFIIAKRKFKEWKNKKNGNK